MRVGGCEGVRTGIMRMDRLVLMNIDLGKNIKEQRAITTCLNSILHCVFGLHWIRKRQGFCDENSSSYFFFRYNDGIFHKMFS